MPVERCTSQSRPGYRWGKAGKCYTYKAGNTQSRVSAREKAAKQGRAIKGKEK